MKKIKSDTSDNKICEILSVPGNDLFASKKYSGDAESDAQSHHLMPRTFKKDKIRFNTPDNKICEIVLSVPGNDLGSFRSSTLICASKKCSTFEEAIIKAVDAIKRQINDNKPENQVTTPL